MLFHKPLMQWSAYFPKLILLAVRVGKIYQGNFSKPTIIIQVLNATFLCPCKLSCPWLCLHPHPVLFSRDSSCQTHLAFHQTNACWDFPGGPVVKILPSNAEDAGSVPGQEAKIPHTSWAKNQNRKQEHYCN